MPPEEKRWVERPRFFDIVNGDVGGHGGAARTSLWSWLNRKKTNSEELSKTSPKDSC
jgi:hypothetical protein